ncbi:hypothetical protein [Aquariibacter albus]|uniref:Uncharacterized protein n=1 Tax=Aquariibacter albus TaxID=2759899 RepID=A0A839HH65_9BURK|nr:hypothetical protein [Aquariibacter albus]MBB1161727.1 hypothetical protein [Aquariibacter albus]
MALSPSSRPSGPIAPRVQRTLQALGRPARPAVLGLALALAQGATTAADPVALLQAAGLTRLDGQWHLPNCTTPVKPEVERHELNGEAPAEAVVFLAASRCLPAHPGGSLRLMALGPDGGWQPLSDWMQGVELVLQPGRHGGWLDLGVATSGGCMPLFRWQGGAYQLIGQRAIQPGGCALRE